VDRLKQLREPAAMVALIGLALHFVLTLIYFLVTPVSDDLLLLDLAVSLINPVLVALLAVLVASCWVAEATPRARGLTLLALLLTAGLLVTALGLLVAGLARAPADAQAALLSVVLGVVPWLTTTVIALGVFAVLLRRPAVAAMPVATAEVTSAQPLPAGPIDPQLQPGWSPDAAIGAAWRRAGDAAAGAPATGWEAPGQTAGWWGPPPETPPPATPPAAERPDFQGNRTRPGLG
jgi:hypothetical protein